MSKVSLFACMHLYVRDPENATRKLLFRSTLSKVAGSKINMQNLAASLYSNNEHAKK